MLNSQAACGSDCDLGHELRQGYHLCISKSTCLVSPPSTNITVSCQVHY